MRCVHQRLWPPLGLWAFVRLRNLVLIRIFYNSCEGRDVNFWKCTVISSEQQCLETQRTTAQERREDQKLALWPWRIFTGFVLHPVTSLALFQGLQSVSWIFFEPISPLFWFLKQVFHTQSFGIYESCVYFLKILVWQMSHNSYRFKTNNVIYGKLIQLGLYLRSSFFLNQALRPVWNLK